MSNLSEQAVPLRSHSTIPQPNDDSWYKDLVESGLAKVIPLTRGYSTIVDPDDYEWLSQFKWKSILSKRQDGTIKNVYAQRDLRVSEKTKTTFQSMHRAILRLVKHEDVSDHINHNGLDNRRSNLRRCTNKKNQENSVLRIDNKSGFKGVHWSGASNKWTASIRHEGKHYHLGLFLSKEEAAKAYEEKSKQLFGEFAFIPTVNTTLL